MKRVFIFSIFLFLVICLFAQEKKPRSIGFGVSLSGSNGFRASPFSRTPYIFYKFDHHEIFAGVDFCFNDIYGIQGGYKYFLTKTEKHTTFFVNCNLQYIQYGTGCTVPVPYNYLPETGFDRDKNLLRYKSFFNNYGIGINTNFLKRCSSYFILGGGFNYCSVTISPTNTQGQYYIDETGNKLTAIFFVKLGMSINLWNSEKKKK